MDQSTLSILTVTELKSLCFVRDVEINGKMTKQTLINKLLIYDKRNNYKKLKFEENLRDWKKDQLVLELRARGTKSGTRNKQDIAYKLMHNLQSPLKKKTKSNVIIENNQNKNKKGKEKQKIKPKKKSKLKQKEEKMMKAYKTLESININIWSDLQNGFKPVNLETKLPHKYTDFHDKLEITEEIGDELDYFGHKLVKLLPLILEIESILNDFSGYKKKIIKKKQQTKNKKIFYVGIKKYKNKKRYNQDEIGPICGVFDNIKLFDQFKNDPFVKKEFGKKIARIRYVPKPSNVDVSDHISEDESLSDNEGDIISNQPQTHLQRKRKRDNNQIIDESHENPKKKLKINPISG